jgi:hypothetical protein
VQAGLTAQGLISVNSSRAILYASNGADFADAARREALTTRDVLTLAMGKQTNHTRQAIEAKKLSVLAHPLPLRPPCN